MPSPGSPRHPPSYHLIDLGQVGLSVWDGFLKGRPHPEHRPGGTVTGRAALRKQVIK